MLQADKVKRPILLIHGEDDNNTGTFPMQVLLSNSAPRCYCSERGLSRRKQVGRKAKILHLSGHSLHWEASWRVGNIKLASLLVECSMQLL